MQFHGYPMWRKLVDENMSSVSITSTYNLLALLDILGVSVDYARRYMDDLGKIDIRARKPR